MNNVVIENVEGYVYLWQDEESWQAEWQTKLERSHVQGQEDQHLGQREDKKSQTKSAMWGHHLPRRRQMHIPLIWRPYELPMTRRGTRETSQTTER